MADFRLTEAARQVMLMAKSLAMHNKDQKIAPEHVLAGLMLCEEQCLARCMGVEKVKPDKDLERLLRTDPAKDREKAIEQAAKEGKMPFSTDLLPVIHSTSPIMAKVVKLSRIEEQRPLHIASALLLSDCAAVARFLKANHLTSDEAKTQVQRLLSQGSFAETIRQLSEARDILRGIVFGQDHAIESLLTGYLRHVDEVNTGITRDHRPISFLFIGDSGTGKTFLAKEFQRALERVGETRPIKVIDMSRYSDAVVSRELIGWGEPFAGNKRGELTGIAEDTPNAIIVLDECDRCHVQAINIILQALNDGVLTDSNTGKEVSFHDNTFILPTNSGRDMYLNDKTYGFFRDGVPQQVMKDALKRSLPPETHALIDRISEPVLFSPLGFRALRRILTTRLDAWERQLRMQGMTVDWGDRDGLMSLMLLHGGMGLSGRAIDGLMQTCILQPFNQWRLRKDSEAANLSHVKFNIEDVETLTKSDAGPLHILLIDDDAKYRERVARVLEGEQEIECSASPDAAEELLKEQYKGIGLILLDLNLSANGGEAAAVAADGRIGAHFRPALALLKHIRKSYPQIPVHVHSGYLDAESSPLHDAFVDCGGAAGFVPKMDDREDDTEAKFRDRINEIMLDLEWERVSNEHARRGERLAFSRTRTKRRADDGDVTLNFWFENLDFQPSPTVEDLDWFAVEIPDVTFDDLVGVDAVRQRFEEAIAYLHDPASFAAEGVFPPKGYLLYGPPGTGKTSVAKAVANAARALFISVNGGQFRSKWVGESAENVRKLFQVTRKYSPVIVFIDEIDGLGHRVSGDTGATQG